MKIEDVLNAYPSRLGEAEVTDSDKLRDLREWAESATSMLCELKNEAQDVDDCMAALIAERDQLRKMHDGVSADLDRERREHQEAMAEAAARELKLTEECDELSKRYNRAADDLQAALEQAEHDVHKLTDADELTMENLRLERLVKQLTGKVKRREADIERYRAELAKKPDAKRSRRKS